jgi:hypothetical protein
VRNEALLCDVSGCGVRKEGVGMGMGAASSLGMHAQGVCVCVFVCVCVCVCVRNMDRRTSIDHAHVHRLLPRGSALPIPRRVHQACVPAGHTHRDDGRGTAGMRGWKLQRLALINMRCKWTAAVGIHARKLIDKVFTKRPIGHRRKPSQQPS